MNINKINILLVGFGILTSTYASENILELLKKYEKEADLSKQTKQETLGHLIVISRKDLDIMQAYTLADVLKMLPLFNFGANKFGVESLAISGKSIRISTNYRLYIDDYEVSSIHTYSPFLSYDRYPLDNIDHIEVYYSSGSSAVSNEPSIVIIKLYTKNVKRENKSKIRLTLETKNGYTGVLNFNKKINKDTSVLLTISKMKIDFEKPVINNNKIDRNQDRYSIFFKLIHKNSNLDISFVSVDRGVFAGFSADKSPDDGKLTSKVGYIAFTHKFLEDKSLKLSLSYDLQSREIIEKNKSSEGGIVFLPLYDRKNPPVYMDEKVEFHKYSALAEKTFKTKNNELLVGLFFRDYIQHLEKLDATYKDGSTSDLKNKVFRVKNFKFDSFYLEDNFYIKKNLIFNFNYRFDHFKFYGQSTKNKHSFRTGLIFKNEKYLIKSFYNSSYILPSMLEIESSKENALNPMDFYNITFETGYSNNKLSINGYYGYFEFKNSITFDPAIFKLINTDQKQISNIYGLKLTYNINLFNYLDFSIWSALRKTEASYPAGAYLRLFTEYKKLQVYNELIYKKGFTYYNTLKIKDSIMYTVAVSYKLPHYWRIRFKGENILGNLQQVPYFVAFNNSVGSYNAVDRKLLLTIEKAF